MFFWPRGRTARTWTSLLALLLGACGGESDPSVPTEISLNTATLAFTSVGATQQLTATVVDQRGDPLTGASVSWTSSNEVVATVSATGLVTATGPGSAEITASSGEASTTADVNVTQVLTTLDQVSGNGQAAIAGQVAGAAARGAGPRRDRQRHSRPDGPFRGDPGRRPCYAPGDPDRPRRHRLRGLHVGRHRRDSRRRSSRRSSARNPTPPSPPPRPTRRR